MFEDTPKKELYFRFTWQFCLFTLTACIGASVIQAVEYSSGTSYKLNETIQTKNEFIGNFSKMHNISHVTLTKFLEQVKRLKETYKESMTFTEALLLVLSIFYTIGWGHVVPISSGGKAVAVIFSLIGIPLAFVLVITGGCILTRHVLDFLRISQSFSTAKANKYADNKINASSKKLLAPVLISVLVFYVLGSSAILTKIEGFSYADALWYSFITLSTIGFGDVKQNSTILENHVGENVGLLLFTFFWLLIGLMIVASCLISIFPFQNKLKIKKLAQHSASQKLAVHPNEGKKLVESEKDIYEPLD